MNEMRGVLPGEMKEQTIYNFVDVLFLDRLSALVESKTKGPP